MIIHSNANRLFTSLFPIISTCALLTLSACAGDKPEKETVSSQFKPAEITHLKEEMLNGKVKTLTKYSYGAVVKTENGWIKGNMVTKRNSMFGENGNMDLTTEEYYGTAEILIEKSLSTYQYDNNNVFTGATITSPSGETITQTVEWKENKRTITNFIGEDVSDIKNVIGIQTCSFNPDGSISVKVTDDGPDAITLFGYNYGSENTVVTVQNKTTNTESKIYRTVLEKDKHNNPLAIAITYEVFNGFIADGYEEYEYTYWDE